MLVHICCSVDSHYFLKRLRETLPDEPLVGFFYNPNIHPYEEYKLRLLDVKRSCDKYKIHLIEGGYESDVWFDRVKGFECEKERGARCDICFEARLEVTAKKAKELGEKTITTTLFMSPKKSFEQLQIASKKIGSKENVEALCFDFRRGGGTNEQFKIAKIDRLYHQNYCGCIYALISQREAQKRPTEELMCPIGRDILPSSVFDRLNLYEKVYECEKRGQSYEIERVKLQNYRLLFGRVLENGKTVPSYFIGEYWFGNGLAAKIVSIKDGFGFTENKTLFIDLSKFNELAGTNYKNVKELIFNPIKYQKCLEIGSFLTDSFPIIVLDDMKETTYMVEVLSAAYQDVREVLAIV